MINKIETELEVHQMLAVSTGNLKESTRRWLDDQIPESEYNLNCGTERVLAVYRKGMYGWFIPLAHEQDDLSLPWLNGQVPAELQKIIAFATVGRFTWLMLDSDAPHLPSPMFPQFE